MPAEVRPPAPSHQSPPEIPARVLLGQNRILTLLAGGTPIDQVLTEFCHLLDHSLPGVRCCVMVRDTVDGTLKVGAAPSLPAAFRDGLEGIAADAGNGSCAAAATRNETVVCADIGEAPEWTQLRELALGSGMRSSWSTPVRGVHWTPEGVEGDNAGILGTVAFYFSEERTPEEQDLRVLQMASSLTGLAISSSRSPDPADRGQLYDSVTGLPNRKVFGDKLGEALTDVTPHDDKLAVLLLDLDHFKEVNDSFGFAVGDFLLRSVAERLISLRRGSDLVARFGDDEFGILISDLTTHDEVKQFAGEVLESIAAPHDFGGQRLAVTGSLGASLYPWDGEDTQTLMRNAENALIAAKKQGRNRFRLYAPTMGGFAFDKLQLKMALGYAVENEELELHFQPKVSSRDGKVRGAEALVRWNHPSKGLLSAPAFIPLAEESGLIVPIGDWVLRDACERTERWRRKGFYEMSCAVNISAHQFRERGFVDKVAATLERTGLEPDGLELEITETIAMTEVEYTMQRMRELQEVGIRISIDDFGTGYSSLAYLKRFPIHTLKIDKSFVAKVPKDKENTAIVKAVIALAHALGLELVAEGVETEEQAEFLQDLGCELLQGYFYSRPIAGGPFEKLLREMAEHSG